MQVRVLRWNFMSCFGNMEERGNEELSLCAEVDKMCVRLGLRAQSLNFRASTL